MCSVPTEAPAAVRARWVAELSEALDSARQLLVELDPADAGGEAIDLYARIEAARSMVQSLRLSRAGIEVPEVDPKWTGLIPWQLGEAVERHTPSGKSPPPAKGSR